MRAEPESASSLGDGALPYVPLYRKHGPAPRSPSVFLACSTPGGAPRRPLARPFEGTGEQTIRGTSARPGKAEANVLEADVRVEEAAVGGGQCAAIGGPTATPLDPPVAVSRSRRIDLW